jgi:alpha-ketoglutarate-dependent taurine dioxygenase
MAVSEVGQEASREKTGRKEAMQRDWPFEVKPLSPGFGCEIIGLSLEEAAKPEIFAHVHEAFLDYQLILFRDVDLPPAVQVAFAANFGEPQVHVMNQYHGYEDFPEIFVLNNLDSDGNPSGKHPDKGTLHWHTDGSWRDQTGLATMMYSEIVPSDGGQTHFLDTYGAYDALDAGWKQRIDGMKAVHNLDFSRSRRHGEDPMTEAQKVQVPPVPHPIARTHPETGRKCLFLGDHAQSIEGMDYDAGRALVEEINANMVHEELIYRHTWQPREVIVWDNRCMLHQATTYDTAREPRVMRRCTVLGDAPR